MSAANSAPRVYFPPPNPRAALTIPITQAERQFILLGLYDVVGIVERILHGPAKPGEPLAPQWQRATLVQNTWRMITCLRGGGPLLVIGDGQRRLLAEAIEHNPYFQIPKSDPRLNGPAITQADALRLKVQAILGRRLRRFPVGLPAGTETARPRPA